MRLVGRDGRHRVRRRLDDRAPDAPARAADGARDRARRRAAARRVPRCSVSATLDGRHGRRPRPLGLPARPRCSRRIAGLRPKASGRIAIDGETLMDTRARALPAARAPAHRLRAAGRLPLSPSRRRAATCASACAAGRREDSSTRPSSILEIDAAARPLSRHPLRRRAPARRPRPRDRDRAPPAAPRRAPRRRGRRSCKERILPYLLRVRDTLQIPFLYVTHNAGEAARRGARGARCCAKAPSSSPGAPARRPARPCPIVDPDARFDNILAGTLDRPAGPGETGALRVGQARFAVPADEAVEPVPVRVYSVAPDDILVSTRPLAGTLGAQRPPGHGHLARGLRSDGAGSASPQPGSSGPRA